MAPSCWRTGWRSCGFCCTSVRSKLNCGCVLRKSKGFPPAPAAKYKSLVMDEIESERVERGRE